MKNQSLKYHSIKKIPVMQSAVTTTTISEIDMFVESIKTKASLRSYKQAIHQFTEETGSNLSKESNEGKALQERLIGYIVHLKHGGTSYGRISHC